MLSGQIGRFHGLLDGTPAGNFIVVRDTTGDVSGAFRFLIDWQPPDAAAGLIRPADAAGADLLRDPRHADDLSRLLRMIARIAFGYFVDWMVTTELATTPAA